jgi:integrase
MSDTSSRANVDQPTRTASTEAAYMLRFRQLWRAALNSAIVSEATINRLIDWLLSKQPHYRSSSWRQVRSAVIFALQREAADRPDIRDSVRTAISRLKAARSGPKAVLPPMTSSHKAKRLIQSDLDRICFASLANGGKTLAIFLRASALTGLRPCEWQDARFQRSTVEGFDWELIVDNAKNSNGRATGPVRTLRWHKLPADLSGVIQALIAIVERNSRDSTYSRMIATLRSQMTRLTRQVFPRRKNRPTMYTPRHEAAARWKDVYVKASSSAEQQQQGLAIVAALLGHASDATASNHYGRPDRGRHNLDRYPAPCADPGEIARVRPRYNATALEAIRSRPPSPRGL